MTTHNIKLTTEEVFEAVRALKTVTPMPSSVEDHGLRLVGSPHHQSAFIKLSSVLCTTPKTENYDYEIPEFKPIKEEK